MRRGKSIAKHKNYEMSIGVTSTALKHLLDSKNSLERARLRLEDEVPKHECDLNGRLLNHYQNYGCELLTLTLELPRKRSHTRQRQLTPLQSLSHLESYLGTAVRDIEIDYLTLTKTCNKLMASIREGLVARFGPNYKSHQEMGQSNDPSYVVAAVCLLRDNDPGHSCPDCDRERRKLNMPNRQDGGGEHLRVARDLFEDFFNTNIRRTLQN